MNRAWFIALLFLVPGACREGRIMEEKESGIGHNVSGLHLSDQQVLLGNITVNTPGMRILGEELLLHGVVEPDQDLARSVSVPMMGRIVKLYVKSTGEGIKAGQPLFRIYSDDLGLTIRELLLSLEKKEIFGNTNAGIDQIITASREKLEQFGLTIQQISEIEQAGNPVSEVDILSPLTGVIIGTEVREGQYVMAGMLIFRVVEFTSVWIEALVFTDDLKHLSEGEQVRITFPTLAGAEFTGKISLVLPELDPGFRNGRIRIKLDNPAGKLVPGSQAYVLILKNRATVLSLPTDAIIPGSGGASVWIKTGPGHFESRMVETGLESGGFTEIKQGLTGDDSVVISGAYLLHSEYMFTRGSSPMDGHGMGHNQ